MKLAKMIRDEFTDLPVSRQRKWQLRKEKLDLCTTCGDKTNLFIGFCDSCAFKRRIIQQKRLKCTPWREGKRGRPPLEVERK